MAAPVLDPRSTGWSSRATTRIRGPSIATSVTWPTRIPATSTRSPSASPLESVK